MEFTRDIICPKCGCAHIDYHAVNLYWTPNGGLEEESTAECTKCGYEFFFYDVFETKLKDRYFIYD